MTTQELHDYCETEGLERALDKFESEPDDDAGLATAFDMLAILRKAFDDAAAEFLAQLESNAKAEADDEDDT